MEILSNHWPLFVLIAFFVAVWFWIRFSQKQASLRQSRLAELAKRKSLQFNPDPTYQLVPAMQYFSLFQLGVERIVSNAFSGTVASDDRTFTVHAGDFLYKAASGKNRQTMATEHSFVLVSLPIGVNGAVSVRLEKLVDKVAGTFGLPDINFESEEFSRKFYITGEDKRFAYALFDPRMIRWLLETPPPDFVVSGGWLLVFGPIWSEREFERSLDWAGDFVRHCPRNPK